MLGTPTAYFIWYGTWNDSSESIVTQFVKDLGGSPWYSTMTSYYDSHGTSVSNAVAYGGSTTDAYSRGKSLKGSDIQAIVKDAITSNRLTKSANAVYMVVTASDVNVADDAPDSTGHVNAFCTDYCGWHTHATIDSTDIKYAFIGNGSFCSVKSQCLWSSNLTKSPNENVAADTMVSVVAHELVESVSDPDLDGWSNPKATENGDLCAWKSGTTYPAANGSTANVRLNGRDYLIQENWMNAGGGSCVLGNPAATLPPAPTNCTASVGCGDSVGVRCDIDQDVMELQRWDGAFWKTVSSDAYLPRYVYPLMTDDGSAVNSAIYRACNVTSGGRTCGASLYVTMPHTACAPSVPSSGPPAGCYYDTFRKLHCHLLTTHAGP
jgi:hypothetical protein